MERKYQATMHVTFWADNEADLKARVCDAVRSIVIEGRDDIDVELFPVTQIAQVTLVVPAKEPRRKLAR